jgi:hypothetical protein
MGFRAILMPGGKKGTGKFLLLIIELLIIVAYCPLFSCFLKRAIMTVVLKPTPHLLKSAALW